MSRYYTKKQIKMFNICNLGVSVKVIDDNHCSVSIKDKVLEESANNKEFKEYLAMFIVDRSQIALANYRINKILKD